MSTNNEEKRLYPFLAAIKDDAGKIVVHIDTQGVASPSAAGILLVDIARHYARMFAQTGGARSEEAALLEIRRMFEAEWDFPTDVGEGGIPS
jgi:hypothetical protein